ncbi:mitochondrial K+-H+ exchange-related-domain-containing protein [Multifurca ochricompacta]|uniref:Mitochondrial K+-H+ exchange-related-domain-containing protein n=1 Tax=Multifurca ochricompacta TaxID=376703 RepID=A0AAD4M812_9AGAM|nr:mitochondrial K+-H+ exchange-related-domain-containing protein [Multifurca ochricompacta]
MRIIALPLTSSVRSPRLVGSPSPLVYYHFQVPPKAANKRSGWVDWATGKAAGIWAQFGKASESSWKFKIFTYGERLVDRVDFEELALKGVDPSMGPKLSHPRSPSEEQTKTTFIPLVHPKFVGTSLLVHLETILARRTPRHRKGFYTWMLLAPLTAPFMLIPVVPNLPFFFCVWRSWSHYRAYKASEYLQSLLHRGAIVSHSDVALDGIYATHVPSESLHDSTKSISEDGREVLLSRDAVPRILEVFGLPESAASDIYRAIEQAKARLPA